MEIYDLIKSGSATYAEIDGPILKLSLVYDHKSYEVKYEDCYGDIEAGVKDELTVHQEGTEWHESLTVWDICDRYPTVISSIYSKVRSWIEDNEEDDCDEAYDDGIEDYIATIEWQGDEEY